MPETEEYLAMDVEKLQNGFDKMKIPLKVKDLPSIDENDERIPPHSRGKKPTELEGLVFKTMCELIIAEGEKTDGEEEKVVELDPVAQAKLDKKKEANRKTKERKKAAKKAKKDSKAPEMDEKEGFKLEVVDEEAPPPATSPV